LEPNGIRNRRREIEKPGSTWRPRAGDEPPGNVRRIVGDYTNPILKPATAEVVKKRGEIEEKYLGCVFSLMALWAGF
jgi:hypothetical protein